MEQKKLILYYIYDVTEGKVIIFYTSTISEYTRLFEVGLHHYLAVVAFYCILKYLCFIFLYVFVAILNEVR